VKPAYDVVVVGSGVAGLSVALGLAATRTVAVVTSGLLGSGSTVWAQGGIAAAVGSDDEPRLHAADTMAAGAGMCGAEAVRTLTEEAPIRLAELVATGAALDRDADGRLALTREGGHHRRRVAHAGGDASGAEVSRALVAAVRRTDVDVVEETTVVDLVRVRGRNGSQVAGVRVLSAAGETTVAARAVVLATGGIGGVYAASTNPVEVTGDGLALALRAGASLVDLEFVQFHPTALRVPGIAGQIPLVSEALRGEGAVLRDLAGRRIMTGHHPMADLAPRDIVARRIDEVMSGTGGGVVLDATKLGAEALRTGFPTVYDACRRHGIDAATEPIPVAPAQHFLCGGVRTDSCGATDVTGLYVVGEVAGTGVHGANRLASNSLVEGMVFGRQVAARLTLDLPPSVAAATELAVRIPVVADSDIATIRATMTRYAGIRRTGQGLEAAAAVLAGLNGSAGSATGLSADAGNRWTVAAAIVAAAHARQESRGCHWRADYPATSEHWRRPVVVRLDEIGSPAAVPIDSLERIA
jgi:L-aspartate oxidase